MYLLVKVSQPVGHFLEEVGGGVKESKKNMPTLRTVEIEPQLRLWIRFCHARRNMPGKRRRTLLQRPSRLPRAGCCDRLDAAFQEQLGS